jgi:hypothetical protein
MDLGDRDTGHWEDAARVERVKRVLRRVQPLTGAGVALLRLTYRTLRPVLAFRGELPVLLARRRLIGCGVEVGVKRGEFSEQLLSRWPGHLLSVDPWLSGGEDWVNVDNVEQPRHEAFYEETRHRLAGFGERSTIWRMTGAEAAARVPRRSLDFVYLDARHDYESVKQDLACWFDRMRPGGVLAGHDYIDGLLPEGDFGVRSAVDEFFAARGLPVRHTFADPPFLSWWVLVPRASRSVSARAGHARPRRAGARRGPRSAAPGRARVEP